MINVQELQKPPLLAARSSHGGRSKFQVFSSVLTSVYYKDKIKRDVSVEVVLRNLNTSSRLSWKYTKHQKHENNGLLEYFQTSSMWFRKCDYHVWRITGSKTGDGCKDSLA